MLVIITCNQNDKKVQLKRNDLACRRFITKTEKKTLLQLSSFCASSIFRYSISKKTKKQINHMAILLIHLLNVHCIYLWIYKFVQSCICCRMTRNIYLHWGAGENRLLFLLYIATVPLFVYFLSEYKHTLV